VLFAAFRRAVCWPALFPFCRSSFGGGWFLTVAGVFFSLAKRFLMMPCHFSHHPDTQNYTRVSTRHVNYAAATWHLMSHQMVHIPLLRVQ